MNNEYEAQLSRLRALANVDDMLEKLKSYWTSHPYLRLGQIVSNAWRIHPDYRKNPEPDIQDVFYLSDAKFIEGLKLLEKPADELQSKSAAE